MSYKPDVCYFHRNCADGFGAAYSIWTKWPDIEFVPLAHGDPISASQYVGKHVIFVDFSLKANAMRDLGISAKSVVILDHHKSAELELESFAKFDGSIEDLEALMVYWSKDSSFLNVYVHFDMLHSGAVLAWNFANPGTPAPIGLLYIEDRDLWNWNLEGSKAFGLALESEIWDFEHWDMWVLNPGDAQKLVEVGESIISYQAKLIKQITSNAKMGELPMPTDDGTKRVAKNVVFCNTAVLQSEVGNALLQQFIEADFAAVWYITADGDTRYSLRSEEGRADVSVIAAEHGGGGHRNAAGFTVAGD